MNVRVTDAQDGVKWKFMVRMPDPGVREPLIFFFFFRRERWREGGKGRTRGALPLRYPQLAAGPDSCEGRVNTSYSPGIRESYVSLPAPSRKSGHVAGFGYPLFSTRAIGLLKRPSVKRTICRWTVDLKKDP